MGKLLVGLQLFSVRDEMAADFEGTLRAIKEMGYDAVEFAGIFDHSGAEVHNICEKIGIIPLSAHVAVNVFKPDIAATVKAYHDIGCRYIAIPWADRAWLPGGDGYGAFLDDVRAISAEMRKCGMKLCYHNHDFEFDKIDGKNKLDLLYSETTPEELQTQIDTCWARVGGENPAAFVRKYTGRAPTVHIKDYVGSKSAKMYDLIDGGTVEEDRRETGRFELRPVGYGLQDVASLLAAAKDAGSEAVIVEQDEPSMGKSRLECAKMSIDYIRSIGY